MSQYVDPQAANAPGGARLVASWALVAIPLAWGVYYTLVSAARLFGL